MNERQPRGRPARTARTPRVFVSYRRDDAAPYAGRLYDALAGRFGDDNVFMDLDTIELGTDYTEAIDRAIAASDAVIALVGRGWLSATDDEGTRRLDDPQDLLRLELERALAGDVVVIPTCVQGAELPAPDALPPSLAPLVRRQAIELRDAAWRDDVGRLTRRLEALVEPPAAPVRRAVPRPRRTWAALAVVALALAAAAVALALVLGGRGGDGRDGEAAEVASRGEARLLAAIPAAIRSTCGPIDWGPDTASASVSCSGARASVVYHLFQTADALDAWYVLRREELGIAPGSGACEPASFRGEAPFPEGEGLRGRYLCYLDEDAPELVWTDMEASVGAEANVWEGTGPEAAERLLRQWRCCFRSQA